MKIASVTNVPLDPALGSGKTVLAWSQGLKRLGHEVIVYPPNLYSDFATSFFGSRIQLRLAALALESVLMKGNFNLVEFYGAEFGFLIRKLSRIPLPSRPLLIAHTNGLEILAQNQADSFGIAKPRLSPRRLSASLLQPIVNKCNHWAFSKVDAFAAICKADLKYIISHDIHSHERCAVFEPGIDDCFLSAPWQRPKNNWIVHIGLWCSRKDPKTTVNVTSKLLARNPSLELHMLGCSSLKETVLSSFDQSLRDRIYVYPRLSASHMVEVVSQAKVLLLPSLYEGFGMATTEAMACGCVVIVTPTGFGAEIQDGLNGFICNFRDETSMVNKCQKVLDDEVLRRQIAFEARKLIVDLNWPNQVLRLESIYKSWLRYIR